MKGEKGFSLMEVALAIALLGVVAIAYLGALATGSKAIMIADERATAESLARTQIEYVRSQEYSSADWNYTVTSTQRDSTDPPTWWDPGNDNPPLLSVDYNGYTASIVVEPVHVLDDGIQIITVTIQHTVGGEPIKEIFDLEGYRSLR
jgi:prepilin-type N-terminal cleavage/methylation domain-containing protein